MGVSASTLSPAAARRATSGLPEGEGATKAGARRRGRTARRAGRSGAVDREAGEMIEHGDLDIAAAGSIGREGEGRRGSGSACCFEVEAGRGEESGGRDAMSMRTRWQVA